jgi:hypothetical protein
MRIENVGMQEPDDSLMIDFRPHLQAQILRAAERLHECRIETSSEKLRQMKLDGMKMRQEIDSRLLGGSQ